MFRLFGRMLGLQLVWLVAACAVLEVKPERVEIPPESKHFIFAEKTPSGRALSDDEIINLIISQISDASGIRRLQQYRGDASNINKIRGLDIKRDGNTVRLAYINGDYHLTTRSTYKTEIVAEYRIQVLSDGGRKQVTVHLPTQVELKPGKSAIFLPISPLLKTAEAIADIRTMSNAINPEFKDAFRHSGEVNVKYNDESVYANFERILGSYEYRDGDGDVKKYDIEKGKVFRISDSGDIFPVKISVFPYRNGSKVLYEFAIPYTIKNDGTTTFDNSKVSKYSALIAKVAND